MTDNIRVEEIAGERYYNIGNKRYVSVTTPFNILEKHGLNKWIERVGAEEAKRVCDNASDYGTRVHTFCEKIMLGAESGDLIIPDMHPDFIVAINRFYEWFTIMVDEVVGVEETVHSDVWGVAGRLDALLVLKGRKKISMCDVKTGQIKKIARMQTAAYTGLSTHCSSLTMEDFGDRIIIPLPRGVDKPIKIKEFKAEETAQDLEAYLGLITLWRWLKRTGG